jgi:integrase
MDVPTDLVSVVGKTTLKKSLKTADEATAKHLLWPVIQKWQREFKELRLRRALDQSDMEHAVWQHYTDSLERDEVRRQTLPTQRDIDDATERAVRHVQREGIDIKDPLAVLAGLEVQVLQNRVQAAESADAHARRIKLSHLRKHLATGETALIEHELDAFLAKKKLVLPPDSPDRKELARKLIRAEIEFLRRTLERDEGDYSGVPLDPIVKPANGKQRPVAEPGESVMELFDQYAAENPNQVKTNTLNQARRDIGLFAEFVGSTYPVNLISKKNVREWKALLLKYPVKATESKAFSGMSFEQVVEYNAQIGKPVISSRTVNRHLSSLGAFCKWLVNHGYLDANPVAGMMLSKEKHSKTLTFSVDQLNVIFKSPMFTGCESDEQPRFLSKPGKMMIRDHRYWVPLIMLFSGARPGEIGQLRECPIFCVTGIWSMLPERSKNYDHFQGTTGRVAEGLRAAGGFAWRCRADERAQDQAYGADAWGRVDGASGL